YVWFRTKNFRRRRHRRSSPSLGWAVSGDAIDTDAVFRGAIFRESLRALGFAPLLNQITTLDKIHQRYPVPTRIRNASQFHSNDRSHAGVLGKALVQPGKIRVGRVNHF